MDAVPFCFLKDGPPGSFSYTGNPPFLKTEFAELGMEIGFELLYALPKESS